MNDVSMRPAHILQRFDEGYQWEAPANGDVPVPATIVARMKWLFFAAIDRTEVVGFCERVRRRTWGVELVGALVNTAEFPNSETTPKRLTYHDAIALHNVPVVIRPVVVDPAPAHA